jgi:ankyrin repeat protein
MLYLESIPGVLAEHLILKGPRMDYAPERPITPAWIAMRAGSREIVDLLLEHGATPPQLVPGSLAAAIQLNDLEKLKELIAQGATVNAPDSRGRPPLFLAASQGRRAFVEALIAAGADVNLRNARGETPLDVATQGGRTEIAELLREHGAEK